MRRLLLGILAVCTICGCQGAKPRLNAPPHGQTANPSDMQASYEHMIDNALLTDMTVSDVHFLPHRARLNALGEERLSRLASLMQEYGGTIRFNTDLADDDELVERRTEAILAFLDEVGLDTSAEVLAQGLPGGDGMPAEEAILIKQNEATYKAGKKGQSSTPTLPSK